MKRTFAIIWSVAFVLACPAQNALVELSGEPDCDARLFVNGIACTDCRPAVGNEVSVTTEAGCSVTWTKGCVGASASCVRPSNDGVALRVVRESWPTTIAVDGVGRVEVTAPASLGCSTGCSFLTPRDTRARFQFEARPGEVGTVTGATCTVDRCEFPVSDSAKSAVVSFRPRASVALTVEVRGQGVVEAANGALRCQADGGTCSATYELGSLVELTAHAAEMASDASVRWSAGGCTGKTCRVLLASDQLVEADLTNLFALQLRGDGGAQVNGQSSQLPAQFEFAEGTPVSIEAQPEADDTFLGFSGLPCTQTGLSNTCSFPLRSNVDGGLRFSRLIRWVLDPSAAGGQAAISDLHSLADGGVWGATTFSGTNDLFVPPLPSGLPPFGGGMSVVSQSMKTVERRHSAPRTATGPVS